MNPRNTLILFLVAAVLGGFVYFFEIRGEEGRKEAEERAKRLFPGVEAESVEWLELTTTDGTAVRAERRDGAWQLVKPLEFPGDTFALDSIASALAQVQSEAVYEEPQPAEVYGLGDAAKRVRFAAAGSERGLRTGDKTPIGGNAYAAVEGEDPVYVIPSHRVNSLQKSFDDLRDKRMLDFDSSAVQRVVASWPEGRVELARDGESWRLTAPLEGAADADTVNDLLSDLSFLRASGFEDEPGDDAETGLDRPDFSVDLFLAAAEEGGAEPAPLSLSVGRELAEQQRLVRASRPSLYRIGAERIADFPREVSAYRFKRLAQFRAPSARRVEMVFRDEAGPVTISASREGGAWSTSPEPMEPAKIARLVDELSRLEAQQVLAEEASAERLRELGLDPASAIFRVYGESPQEEEGGGETLLAEVHIGKLGGSGGIAARRADGPQLFGLPSQLAEHLPVNLEAFRNRFVVREEEGEPAEEADPLDELPLPFEESP